MSRIYDALKKLEAERLRRGGNGHNGGGNGGNGGGNGGNGGGNGKRKGWRRFFAGNGRTNGHAQVALGCGTPELGAPALFDSPGVVAALEELRKQFEFVIFDLPPANVYADTSILAPRLDAALIVIEADRTRVPEVERTRRSLERVGVKLVGSVLNRRRNYIPAFLEQMLLAPRRPLASPP